jgi:hypothetical protein
VHYEAQIFFYVKKALVYSDFRHVLTPLKGPYSQNFIIFIPHEQAQYVGVFVTGKLLQLIGM